MLNELILDIYLGAIIAAALLSFGAILVAHFIGDTK